MFVRKSHSSFFTLSLYPAFFRPSKGLEGPASLCSFALKSQVMISHGTSLFHEPPMSRADVHSRIGSKDCKMLIGDWEEAWGGIKKGRGQ